MDEFKNLIVILPALGAIVISITVFVFNLPYNSIKNKFNPVKKEYSKIYVGVMTTCTIIYTVVLIMIMLSIFLKEGFYLPGKIYTKLYEGLVNYKIMGSKLTWIYLIILQVFFIGHIIYFYKITSSIISKTKHKFIINMFSPLIVVGASIWVITNLDCVIGNNIKISWDNYAFSAKANIENFEKNTEINEYYIYVNNKKFILYNEIDKENSLKLIRINLNEKNSYFYIDKKFNAFYDDDISFKINSVEVVKEKYKLYAQWINICQQLLVLIIPFINVVLGIGIFCSYSKLNSFKKYKIKYSNIYIVGEICFEYDDFYLIRNNNELKYIAKKEINELICIEHNKNKHKSEIIKSESLKITEIYNLKQLKQWRIIIRYKKILSNCIICCKNFFVNVKKAIDNTPLIIKVLLIILIILIVSD